jgi:NAD(P)-dependent dehydrogenase (short-subunit alcohol dehydrogenase family)
MRVVITGTSSGIGRYLAERLTAQGHQVWGLARSTQSAEYVTSVCDVADWAQIEIVRAAVAKSWPQVDTLICAAAIQGAIGSAMEVDPRIWSETVRVNLDGTFFAIRGFWDLLGAGSRRAKIICFSGGGATKARPQFAAYAASKTGVVRLVETLAAEWIGSPVDINAIAPGAINTRMTEESARADLGPETKAATRQLAEGGQPIGKVLDLLNWLLSSASDGITGRLLSAQWDPWPTLSAQRDVLAGSAIYQLRRILPEERGAKF